MKKMKNIIFLITILPILTFGQESMEKKIKKQIVKISPVPILFGDIKINYEREILDNHSFNIALPFYYKRDIAKMQLTNIIAPMFDSKFSEYTYENSTVKDILKDAENIGEINGIGIDLEYRYYTKKNIPKLTGFYISPQFSFKKFFIDIDASEADISYIYDKHSITGDLLNPNSRYELNGDASIRSITINFGHQWILNAFSIDLSFGIGDYQIKYDLNEKNGDEDENGGISENNMKDSENIFIPKFSLKLGYSFKK